MSAVQDHTELRRADADARALALSLFDRPLFVEAGAGTGKTTTLVARIVAWCVGPGWREAESRLRSARPEPALSSEARPALSSEEHPTVEHNARDASIAESVVAGVLAITFTEAAAAEMEAKIRVALSTLASGAWPRGMAEHEEHLARLGIALSDARGRAAHVSAALERRMVLTIHAWCLSLLAEHPLEVGLAPQFRVDADRTETDEIVRETLEAAIVRAFGAEPDPDWLVLARRHVRPAQIEEAVGKLLQSGVRRADLDREPFTPERIAKLSNDLGQSAAVFVELALPLLEKVKGSLVQAVLDLVEKTCDAIPAHAVHAVAELQSVCDTLKEWWGERSRKRLVEWSRGIFGKTVEKAVGERASALQAASRDLTAHLDCFLRLDPELTTSARRVLASLLSEVQDKLRARGLASFTDLLRDARDLLCDHPEVCIELRRRTRQLLVDEFQDTDPVQCDLVRALALDAIPGAHGIPLPGLFVVGDPKQSIYAWRSADLAAYEGFQRDLAAAGGVFTRLSVNYRSTPAILRQVERAIAPVMIVEPGVQPAFQPLVAHSKMGGSPVEHWVSWELDPHVAKRTTLTSSEGATRIEARWLAAELSRRRAADVPWEEMAILLRTGSTLEIYLEALRERGIPYDVAGDKSYYRRREIIDAASLVRCVIDPLDSLSLITALRSSVIGVPDAALMPLWTAGFPAAMSALAGASESDTADARAAIARALSSIPDDVPGLERIRGWEACLYDAIDKIGGLRRTFANEALDVFVERLRTLFLCEATEAARHLGAWRVANLERFFRHLTRALTADAGDPHTVLRALQRALGDERDAEEARPKTAHTSAVRVMTIHKAKGLDFSDVYVGSMHRDSRGDTFPDVDVAWIEGRAEFVLFGAPSPDYGDVHARRAKHAAAERVRTLYVAMTRAKERLVLMGAWPDKLAKRPVHECHTHLDLLEWSAPDGLIARLLEASDRPAARIELEDTLYVLPPPPRDTAETARDRAAVEIDARAVEADSRKLREHSVAASLRMSRSFASTVSSAIEDHPSAEHVNVRGAAEGSPSRPATLAPRPQLAALAGSAVHRALEEFDWKADIARELARGRAGLRATIGRSLMAPASELESAVHIAETIFDRFARGSLCARLVALRDRVVARELALVSAPSEMSGAVGYVSGAVDLIYRDPGTDELVIADYKTDAVRTEAEASAHAAHYSAQAREYPRILGAALGLAREPRFELWFLQADCVITPELGPIGPTSPPRSGSPAGA